MNPQRFVCPLVAWVLLLSCGPERTAGLVSVRLKPVAVAPLGGLEIETARQIENAHTALVRTLDGHGAANFQEPFDLALKLKQRLNLSRLYGDLGKIYLAHGLTHLAEICFANASQLAPGNFRWKYLRGVALYDSGDFEAALSCWQKAQELNNDDGPVALRLGDVCLTLQRLDLSRQYFEHASTLLEDKAAAYYGLARVAFLQQDFPSAIDLFNKTLSLQPNSSAVHHQLGLCYREVGQVDEATTHFSQAGSRRPYYSDPLVEELGAYLEGARVHLVRGIEAQLGKQPKVALQHFRKAVRLDPKNAHAQHNLGAVLGIQGDHDNAIVHLKKAVDLEPDRKDAHFDLASAYSGRGALVPAEHHLSEVLRLDPGDRAARQRRALVWAALGKKQDALQELKSLAEDSSDLGSRFQLARFLFLDGKFQEAAFHFSAVAVGLPGQLNAHMGLVQSSMALGRERQALDYLEQLPPRLQTAITIKHLQARILATATSVDLRDSHRALTLANEVFRQQATLHHGETVAMAMAASGLFSEAQQWARSLYEQATKGGATAKVLQRLERQLTAYGVRAQAQVDWGADLF